MAVGRQRLAFRRGQTLADPQHHVAGVVPPFADPPQPQLFGKVGSGLAGQRRVGGAKTLSLLAVAGGAGNQPAFRITPMVKGQRVRGHGTARFERQAGVVKGHGLAFAGVELLRDPAHLAVVAPAVRIGFELPFEVAGVQPGEARRSGAVAASVQAVTGETGVGRASLRAAVSDHPAVLGETIKRGRLGFGAARQQGCRSQEKETAHGIATSAAARLFPLAALALAACKPPPDQRQFMPGADTAHGKAVIERAGCGSCHTIPGIRWPQGKVGPGLDGLAERALIAGKLPNEPDVLAAFIRNAPALVPGSGMPAMPVSEAEARDIAAYLYEQGAS